jgi:hypothetical protein
MLTIHDRIEKARLNGHRIPGELYLVGKLVNFQCCKLPLELGKHTVPKRGLVPVPLSISADLPYAERAGDAPICQGFLKYHKQAAADCPVFEKKQFAGMLWVSERYYSHAAMWVYEARTEGVQLRIKQLHCGIEIGKSWVLLAHRKSIVDYSEGAGGWVNEETGKAETAIKYKPGIFTMFLVEGIEYIVPGPADRDFDLLQKMCAAGITLVYVLKEEELAGSDLEEKSNGYE